jgi:signal transduction histidine kinase
MRRPERTDAAIALLLAVTMAAAGVATGRLTAMENAGVTIMAVGLLALAMRRSRPVLAAVAVAVVVAVDGVAAPTGTITPAFVALMLSSYSLAVHASVRGLITGAVALTSAIVIVQAYAPSDGHSRISALTFFGTVLVLAPAGIGSIVRVRSALAERLRTGAEARRSGVSAELASRRAAQLDRVNTAVERVVLTGLDRMRPFAAIRDLSEVVALRDLGRDVLAQMRELLNDLRTDPPDAESRTPSPNISALRADVERVLAGHDGDLMAARRALWTVFVAARIDLFLAVAGGTYALLIVAANMSDPGSAPARILACAAGAGAALSMLLGRRRPLTATTTAMAAVAVYTIAAQPPDPIQGLIPGLCFIAFPLITGATPELVVAAGGLTTCLATALGIGWGRWSELVSSAALAIGAWVAGRILQIGTHTLETDARAAAYEDEVQREHLRRALDDDRARVARDLHDAVGHALTGIVLQATAAARVWESNHAIAGQHVAVLRQSVAETLDDLRPLVTAIAIDDGIPAAETGLADLAERARHCGLTVNLPTRHHVDITGYRIVQEALTNAARYAPGSTVTIHVDDTRIEVVNTAPPIPFVDRSGSGHGLRGMAERAAAHGGSLDAGPTGDGGFRVRALLPRTEGAG